MSEWPPTKRINKKEEEAQVEPAETHIELVSRTHDAGEKIDGLETFQATNEDFGHEADLLEQGATEHYMAIAADIRAKGVEPNDIRAAWGPAYSLLSRMRGAARSYGKAESVKDRKELLKLYNKLSEELSTTVAQETNAAADEWLEDHEPKEVPPEAGLEQLEVEQISEEPVEMPTAPETPTSAPEPVSEIKPERTVQTGIPGIDIDADGPIFMQNPVLNKLFEGKQKKPKAKKPRKSVSMGGETYQGHVFTEPESWMRKPEERVAPAPISADASVPETYAEQKAALRRNVAEIQRDLDTKQAILRAFYANASKTGGIVETERFQAHNGGTIEDSLEKKIVDTETEVRKLEQERAEARDREHNPVPEEVVEAPVDTESLDANEAPEIESNVVSNEELLEAKRARERAREEAKKVNARKRGRRGLTGALAGLVGFFGIASTDRSDAATGRVDATRQATAEAPASPSTAAGEGPKGVLNGEKPRPVVIPRNASPRVRAETANIDPDRSKEIAAIYKAESKPGRPIQEQGLAPGTDARILDFLQELETEEAAAPVAKSVPASAPATEKKIYRSKNNLEVPVQETHLYSIAGDGEESLFVYGGGDMNDKDFLEALQKFAKENPGKTIYFDPGIKTTVNGTLQSYIASGVFDPSIGSFQIAGLPEPGLVGMVINPDSFTRMVK
ncbi:MAG: hypothetical protein AB203_00370 [Parcubacteria bacterium C7867-008]|nr:MAG: hypothetical protein AB203_00370 [Parcubacteria bacterium C7867-008]